MRTTLNFIVDSGSTVSFIPRSIADYLGLDLSRTPERIQGFSHEFECIPASVRVEISKLRGSFSLPVMVHTEKEDYAVLGREGFFTRFDVTISHSKGRIVLKQVQ
jgi:hypothetical protein